MIYLNNLLVIFTISIYIFISLHQFFLLVAGAPQFNNNENIDIKIYNINKRS